MPSVLRASSLVALAIVTAAAAFAARADCVDGVREPTAGERVFVPKAAAALTAALPAPPANMERRGRPTDFKALPQAGTACRGTAEGAFGSEASAGYLYRFPPAEAERLNAERRAVRERMRTIEALPPEKEAERKALEDQARAVYAQAPRRSRSDPPFTPQQQAEVDRKMAQGRALEDRSRQVTAAHLQSVRPQLDPLREEERRLETFPQELVVRLSMNVAKPPAAGSTPQSEVAVFGAPAPARSAGFRVANVVVTVGGPPGPARKALFDSIDAAWLQSLVGKPPPEVAASEAQAARIAAAAPVQVAAPPAAAAPAGSVSTPAPAAATPPSATAPAPGAPAPAASPALPPSAAPPQAATPASVQAAPQTQPQAGAPPPNCPPPSAQQGGQAAQAGAAIGGAVLGGGFGRSLGGMIGGAVGAVAPPSAPPPGCPN
jgi:hypothetical protein